jgi:hypothetical protein
LFRKVREMGNLPKYFSDQMPEPIRRISVLAHRDGMARMPDDYTHITEFSFPILDRDGKPMGTSLGLQYGGPEVSVRTGEQVCLHGVWVEVSDADTVVERDDDNGRVITFCSASVKPVG